MKLKEILKYGDFDFEELLLETRLKPMELQNELKKNNIKYYFKKNKKLYTLKNE